MNKIRNWLRDKIIRLIADDIERIAYRSYAEGRYVEARQRQAEETLRLQRIFAENDKLREMLIDRANLTIPPVVIKNEPRHD